jgi:hypothetical protein
MMDQRRLRSTQSPIDTFTAAPPPPELLPQSSIELVPAGSRTRSVSSVWQQTLQNRTAVLGTLFLVTGALGLPLLWYSPVFSRLEKSFWTSMAVIYTSALIGVTWAILYWCYQMIVALF